jgi:hypothetical protein
MSWTWKLKKDIHTSELAPFCISEASSLYVIPRKPCCDDPLFIMDDCTISKNKQSYIVINQEKLKEYF